MKSIHSKTSRDYLARVNDLDFPKWKAAELAKKFDFDYWDGDRRINYGGYTYKLGYWTPVAERIIKMYQLNNDSKILDVGCGKGYLLLEIKKLLPHLFLQFGNHKLLRSPSESKPIKLISN